MENKQIEKLMIYMERHGIGKVRLKKEGVEIELEREQPHSYAQVLMPQQTQVMPSSDKALFQQPKSEGLAKSGVETKEIAGVFVTSPMVGTFYRAPSPQDAPFVKVGDRVEEGQVVCIVEAMKVMNEIKADVSGVIKEVLLENGDPVEFGTELFSIES